jgi:hypothetical protein
LEQLGDTIKSGNVSAVSLDFNSAKYPVFVYGCTSSNGGTDIPIIQWNGKAWIRKTRRVSQFPQHDDEFQLQVRYHDTFYLGLRVNSKFGSVLNGGQDYAGCYAFTNKLFEYDIDDDGTMHMLWISEHPNPASYPGTNSSLVVTTYDAARIENKTSKRHFRKSGFLLG